MSAGTYDGTSYFRRWAAFLHGAAAQGGTIMGVVLVRQAAPEANPGLFERLS